VALDLTQETFTKMWEYIAEKKEEIREPKSLLYRIATNLVIDYYRKKKSESLEALIEYGFNPEETMSISLEKELEIKELHLKLYKLEDKYKDILIMRFVEDMSLEEIAKVYDQHANTIAVRIHRAIEKLKTLY
jgi:RNA polymerase sigma-70 factor (ECF subfamily)